MLTLVQFKAQPGADGKPAKDANGRFIKGDLVAYTVMEKRSGWGTEYPDDIRNGEWEYQVFGPDKAVNAKANLTACFQCHKPHAGQQFIPCRFASLKAHRRANWQHHAPVLALSLSLISSSVRRRSQSRRTLQSLLAQCDLAHRIRSRSTGAKQRSAVILKGQTARLSFAEAGTYDYI